MKLRGIDFGPVQGASGVQGFFGEGYWFHYPWRPFGLNFSGMTFVAKTTTFSPKTGNLPLDRASFRPTSWYPQCVRVYPKLAVVLNSVGLSGPGAKVLFETGRWQRRKEPFFISFMAVSPEKRIRIVEMRLFVTLLQKHLPYFKTRIGLQLNFSCNNVGLKRGVDELANEMREMIGLASHLEIPIVVKVDVTFPAESLVAVSKHRACDAICISNAIPWGSFPESVPWKELFRSEVSPLQQFGGGALSGWPLKQLTHAWIKKARHAGIRKPIIAGGGILSADDAIEMLDEDGVEAIFLGSVALLRPWRVRGIIRAIQRRRG